MNDTEDPVSRLHRQLDLATALRSSAGTDAAAQSARQRLHSWQAERLGRTHADLLAGKRTGPAASFFLTDLYGATDLGSLAADVRRIVPVMSKLLPTAGLETVADAIELDALSETLDAAMVAALGDKIIALDAAAYGRAYRKVDRRKDRERQIALIEHVGQALERLVRQPFVVSALRLMRKPAKLAGLGELQDFLERGYAAFRQIGDPKEFLDLIVSRERRLLNALFAGDDRPLDG
jgi:hypothetical protein